MKYKITIVLFIITLGFQSCCVLEKGSWDPLPCSENEKSDKEEKTKETEKVKSGGGVDDEN